MPEGHHFAEIWLASAGQWPMHEFSGPWVELQGPTCCYYLSIWQHIEKLQPKTGCLFLVLLNQRESNESTGC